MVDLRKNDDFIDELFKIPLIHHVALFNCNNSSISEHSFVDCTLPTLPSILLSLNWSVAVSNSFELNNFVFWTLCSLEDNCCNNKPPFLLKNFFLSWISLLLFITLYNHHMLTSRDNPPRLAPKPAQVKKIEAQCHK